MPILDQIRPSKINWMLLLEKILFHPVIGVVILCLLQLGLLINFHVALNRWLELKTSLSSFFFYDAFIILSTICFVSYLIPELLLKKRYVAFCTLFSAWYFLVLTPVSAKYYEIINFGKDKLTGFIDYPMVVVETYKEYGFFGHFFNFNFAYIISLDLVYNFGPVIFYCFIKFYLADSLKKSRIDNLRAELEVVYLKQQINPHFLFNSLNNIYGFVMKKDPKTEETIQKLRALLAYSNQQGAKQFVLLGQEVSSILNVIELERIRYSKGLNLEHNLEENINSQLKIAPFILQTFVENAFKHGASTDVDKPTIKIKLTTLKSNLDLEVVNSLPKIAIQKTSNGIGLKNTLRRIELLYPTAKVNINHTTDSYVVQLSLQLEK
jgi:hypothetical protein